MSDAELIGRFQARDIGAFHELYVRHEAAVHAYLRRALRSAADAEDVGQQVFLRVFEALPRYEIGAQPFEHWLSRVARNCVIDHGRRRHWELPEEPAGLARRRDRANEPDPDESPVADDIRAIADQLPLAQRQAMVLRFEHDMSVGEIAEVLDRTPTSVRQLLHRGRRFVRVRLDGMRFSRRETPPGAGGGVGTACVIVALVAAALFLDDCGGGSERAPTPPVSKVSQPARLAKANVALPDMNRLRRSGKRDARGYPPGTTEAFNASCVKGGTPANLCSCIYINLRARYRYPGLLRMLDAAQGRTPKPVLDARAHCAGGD